MTVNQNDLLRQSEQKYIDNDTAAAVASSSSSVMSFTIEETATTSSSPVSSIVLPRNNKEYGTKEYWEHRFATEESFEWLLSYPQLQHQLEPILLQYCSCPSTGYSTEPSPSQPPPLSLKENNTAVVDTSIYDKSLVRILMVGCGNAPFSCHLYDDGYTNIVNIDYSPMVIQNMQQLHSTLRPKMQWMVMDMTRMDALLDSDYDVVIDKAAMDAIMTQEQDVWNPNPIVIQNAYRMCFHISRILQPRGTFVQISLTQPHFRNKYLMHLHDLTLEEIDGGDTTSTQQVVHPSHTKQTTTNECPQFGWTVHSEMAGRSDDTSAGAFGHYLYIMKKGG